MILLTERFYTVIKSIDHPVINQLLKDAKCIDLNSTIELDIVFRFDQLHKDYIINCLDLDDSSMGLISFIPSNKMKNIVEFNVNDADDLVAQFFNKSRQNAKAGKTIAKLFGDMFTEQAYSIVGDLLSNAILAFYAKHYGEVKIVSGEDIRKYYHVNSYAKSTAGTIGSSCMRHELCQEFLDLYVNNSIIKLIIVTNENGILARTLLWNDKYHDRIYYADNHSKQSLIAFCKSNNFIDIYDSSTKVELQLENWLFDQYPYLDSMVYLDSKTGLINNIEFTDRMLNNTDGTYTRYFYCKQCDTWRSKVMLDGEYVERCVECYVWSSRYQKFYYRSQCYMERPL